MRQKRELSEHKPRFSLKGFRKSKENQKKRKTLCKRRSGIILLSRNLFYNFEDVAFYFVKAFYPLNIAIG